MSADTKERWLNFLATTTVIFSVCSTLAASKSGGYSTKSIIAQNQATDQWAYYQAKSIKQHTFQLHLENLEEQRTLHAIVAKAGAEPSSQLAARIQKAREEIERYKKEKDEAMASARKHEAEISECQWHGGNFGQAVIFLQISIMLSAVAALLKKKAVWLAGVAIGLAGMIYFANGFCSFFGTPPARPSAEAATAIVAPPAARPPEAHP